DHRNTAPGQDLRFLAHIDPVLTELEAFGDQFERLARNPEQRQLAADFKDWVHHTSRTFLIPSARTLAEKLSSGTMPQPESPPVKRDPDLKWEDLPTLPSTKDTPEPPNGPQLGTSKPTAGPDQTPAPAVEDPGRQDDTPVPLADQLFGQPAIAVPRGPSA